MLFLRVENPEKASYKIENPQMSIKLLALTVMRSKIGKMKLGRVALTQMSSSRKGIRSISKYTKPSTTPAKSGASSASAIKFSILTRPKKYARPWSTRSRPRG